MKKAHPLNEEPHTAELPLAGAETPEKIEVPAPAADLFRNLDSLRVAPAGAEDTLVESVLSRVPVRKPSKEWFFRVHPDFSLDALLLELREDAETFLVLPNLRGVLLEEKCVSTRTIRLCVNRQGTPFLWPLRSPAEGRKDAWALSAMDAAREAETRWTRMQADMSLGAYRLSVAKVDDLPRWPKESFNELLRIGFQGAVVDSLDHPVLKKLRGEA
jgi:hypothetical protein